MSERTWDWGMVGVESFGAVAVVAVGRGGLWGKMRPGQKGFGEGWDVVFGWWQL